MVEPFVPWASADVNQLVPVLIAGTIGTAGIRSIFVLPEKTYAGVKGNSGKGSYPFPLSFDVRIGD